MFEGRRIGGVLLMGGEGRRFGGGVPKQFHELGGKKVYLHALETFLGLGVFDEIVLVCHRDWMGRVREARVVEGGATRQASSYAGLKGFLERPDIVVIHDAVRPFVTGEVVLENVKGAIEWGAVDTCIPSADTLVYAPQGKNGGVITGIPKREEYLRGQTPQSFQMDWILEAHERALREGVENASDDCRLVLNAGREVRVVWGDERNLKITSEFDLRIAERMLEKAPGEMSEGYRF